MGLFSAVKSVVNAGKDAYKGGFNFLGDAMSPIIGGGPQYAEAVAGPSEDPHARKAGWDLYSETDRRREDYQQLQNQMQDRYLQDAYDIEGQMGDYYGARDAMGMTMEQQTAYGKQLAAAARGEGPSAAQAQLQSGLKQSIAAQNAMAASARGTNAAMAGRTAAMQAGNMQQDATNQAAQLRAKEQQQAMGLYEQHIAQQRAQDLQAMGIGQEQAKIMAQNEYQQRQLNLSQRQQNDAMTQAYLQAEALARGDQMDYSTSRQQMDAQMYNAYMGYLGGIQQANTQASTQDGGIGGRVFSMFK